MGSDKAAGLIALGWLIGALVLMARSIRRGRELAEALAMRHPETYEALGRPRPGYLQSVRRARFARFVARGEFQDLADPELSAQFEDYRRFEARLLLSLLVSLVVMALVIIAVRHTA